MPTLDDLRAQREAIDAAMEAAEVDLSKKWATTATPALWTLAASLEATIAKTRDELRAVTHEIARREQRAVAERKVVTGGMPQGGRDVPVEQRAAHARARAEAFRNV